MGRATVARDLTTSHLYPRPPHLSPASQDTVTEEQEDSQRVGELRCDLLSGPRCLQITMVTTS